MPSVQIGKYKRPGIFIEEFNNSFIETPIVTGNQVLVIGSSKKGPVNTPITLTSQSDLERIFGDIDRTLESKGSYFHRTISKLLENTPVVAMNLLNADDDLDVLEYKSISTSTAYENDVKRTGSYRRFFDTSTFWKKDRESFLSLTSENEGDSNRILHFTNMSDKKITVFAIKSQSVGFDRTLLDWYGSVDKVPAYVDPKDYASDYLVDVVVLSGDWTNYDELAVDPVWSDYFNRNGLVKSELFNLVNNQSVNTLAVWRGLSLIPYFRDANNSNIFIENVINSRTNQTGLYCAFDIDAVETDYRNGLIDILGNELIGNNEVSEINILSYNESIVETDDYEEVMLDRPGNVSFTFVTGGLSGTYSYKSERGALYAEGFVDSYNGDDSSTIGATGASGSINLAFTAGANAYAVVGGSTVSLDTQTFSYSPSDFTLTSTVVGTTQSFSKVYYIDSDGSVGDSPTNTDLQSGIVLGYADIIVEVIATGSYGFSTSSYTAVSVDSSGFNNFSGGEIDYSSDSTSVTLEFSGTNGTADVTDYETYRVWKVYNQLASVFNGSNIGQSSILVSVEEKKSVGDLTVTVTSNTNLNNTIKIDGLTSAQASYIATNGLVLYTIDDEFIVGYGGLRTKDSIADIATYGIVAQYSEMYQDFENGQINTGDNFYENILSSSPTYIQFLDVLGTDYIVSDAQITFNTNEVVKFPDASTNTGTFTITNPTAVTSGLTGATGTYYGYQVSENTSEETVSSPTKVLSITKTQYLKMYTSSDVLYVDFVASDLSTSSTITSGKIGINGDITVNSQDSNYRQTIEIETLVDDNVILVEASRYSEVSIGDFLEAYVDTSSLETGEVGRKLTRILSKKVSSTNSSLVEITTDAKINTYNFGGDLQTYRFTQIDDYVTDIKGISLTGFTVRQDSLPNNTDTRLTEILQIVGKNTPMFDALTDKNLIDFRYLVDSYGLGLTENSKQELGDICGKRLDTFGILNVPSVKSFRDSTSPTFVDSEGRLSTSFIKVGGDPESSPAFNYSLLKGDGASCVGYFTPYVVVNDNGRPRNVPPAAYVATTFLRKHNSSISSVTPWTVAAGITDGQVTGIAGLEYDYTSTDIENLNQLGVNPIVSKRNRGRVIETENTADTLQTSALSLIHVREVLIELERELSDMLLSFQWKANTPEIRAEIKLRADAICEGYVNRNGLYTFFNKCDAENNTTEIIDNQYGVLDTFVEPIKNMGVIVNNITIFSTGSIQSGGFV